MTVAKVFIVDDHPLVRSGVRTELGDAVKVVGESGEVEAAIAALGWSAATGPTRAAVSAATAQNRFGRGRNSGLPSQWCESPTWNSSGGEVPVGCIWGRR